MKKSLLALCAGVLALTASAETYKLGEAFCYNINSSFKWFDNDDRYAADAADGAEAKLNINWPAAAMEDAADLATNTGLAMPWFFGKTFATVAEADEALPVVTDPWGSDAIKVFTAAWWGYGNLNFALPKMSEVCRIRVIYRVDETEVPEQTWYDGTQKTFKVHLTNTDQDGCFAEPMFEEQPKDYWENKGYRVVDLYYQPDGQTYLALTFDSAGLTCGGRPSFYVQAVSCVPVSKIAGDTHTTGQVESKVTETLPELVTVEGEGDAISEIAAAKQAGIYDLQGRKLAAPVKGINIINGVKTLVK